MEERLGVALSGLALVACAARGPDRASAFEEPAAATYAVGFRSSWLLDPARAYSTVFDGGATYDGDARPILVELWYPAERTDAPALLHERYLDVRSDDPRLERFAAGLAAHARAIFVEQVLGSPEAELDPEEREILARVLRTPTTAQLDAPPARGPFPLVVHHSGAGSSFEDDTALCEALASHGYVVVASAYPKADGSSLGIDGERGSAEDAQALVRHAAELPFVDAEHVAFVGHSAGAQAFLKAAASANCAADALVLLDTTQDYYALGLPLYESLERATSDVRHLTEPMLVVASPEAQFALCDTFVRAERVYLTVPDLGHDEFISQGLQRLAAIELRSDGDPAELARAPAVREEYAALCELVRLFLDAHLRGDDAEFRARIETLRSTELGPAMHAELVPAGTHAPETYDLDSPTPPTPRQFRCIVEELGVAPACALLQRFRAREPRPPILTSTMLSGSLLYGLVESGRAAEGRALLACMREVELDAFSVFEFWVDISLRQERRERAEHFLEVGLELDPEDEGLLERRRALEDAAR